MSHCLAISQAPKSPTMMQGIDYARRTIECTKILIPSGNVDADMKEIMDYYRSFVAKHPAKFALDEEYC